MPDFQLGKIYKIIDLNTNETYIGSTCEPTLARRLAKHVSNYKSWLKGCRKYMTSYKIISNGNYDIVLIEKYSCNDKDELHVRESFWAQQINCINKIKNQGLFNKLGKVEYQKQYDKEYNELNKVARHTHNNKKCTCKCGGKYTIANKAIHMKSKKHQEYEKDKLYYTIQKGLEIIKALDKHFNQQ